MTVASNRLALPLIVGVALLCGAYCCDGEGVGQGGGDSTTQPDGEAALDLASKVNDHLQASNCSDARGNCWKEFKALGGDMVLCRIVESAGEPQWTGEGACPYCTYECKLLSGNGMLARCKSLDDGIMNCSAETATPTVLTPSCELGASTICCDGQTDGCGPDGHSVFLCADDGTTWSLADCLDDYGKPLPCMELPETNSGKPVAYCPSCVPGKRECSDDNEIVIECNPWGVGWGIYQTCDSQKKCVMGECSADWQFEK